MRDRRILYLQYTNPAAYPPLEHSSTILADGGWSVLFVGTGAFGASALRFAPRSNVTVVTRPFVAAGWRQKLDYLRFAASVVTYVARWRPRWVYASDILSAPIALLLGFLPGVRIVYHEHDAPETTGRGWRQVFSGWARRQVARRSIACVAPNGARAELLEKDTGRAGVSRVWNCPSVSEVGRAREPVAMGDDLWLLYHGSIVPSRLPEAVVHALARLPERVKLRVVGYETVGHTGYLDELLVLARRLRVEGRIHAIGPVPTRAELLGWCGRSDVGLAFMPADAQEVNEQHMLGASNKPFDYLSQGLALLVGRGHDWVRTFVDGGFALACDPMDPASIAGAVERCLADPRAMRTMGERGRRRILATWNYETQFAGVLRVLNGDPSREGEDGHVHVGSLRASCSR